MAEMTRSQLLDILGALKPEIQRRYRVKDLGLFGSVARGTDTPTSDVDVLVDFEPNANLFQWVGLSQFLEDKLGRKVDVVSKRALRAELRERILKEAMFV